MKFLSQINVNTEYTLPIVDGTNGQVLTTDGSGAVYWGSISIGALNLDGLQDVVITTPTSGQILRYGIPVGSEDPNPVWYNYTPNYLTPSSSIDNLSDVAITSATTGQLLQWNGSAWVNWTPNYLTSYTETDTLATVTTRGNITTNTIDVGGVKTDYVTLDITATPTPVTGMFSWNTADDTANLQLGSGASLQLGQEQHWYVKNSTGVTIPDGTVVMAVGTDGNSGHILAAPMIADGTVEERYVLGVATGNIVNGGFGHVTSFGKVRKLNTSMFQEGAVLYCDPTVPGGLTDIQPEAPNLDIPIAFVISSHATNGILATRVLPGYHLGELHDVHISDASTGQLLRYNSNRWENWTPNYLTTFTETDPTVPSHVKAITTTNISNWNTAYGWGNHALAGYATQTWVGLNYYNEGEIDDFFSGAEPISGYNKSNWDTAYGWGNHASAGYLTAFTETDTLATVTARGSATTGSITVNGYLTVGGGADLYLRANSGSSDSGDIVFQDGTGAELHRLWSGSNTINYRTSGGTTYPLWHSGNLTNLNQLTNGPGYITGYTETDTLASVTARGGSTTGSIFVNGLITGGLGAVTTGGTLDWNDVSNARSGSGYTLLLGTAINGMGGGQYYHPISFEYSSKNGSGNMTQLAIPYTGNGIWYRNRYGGSWSTWARVWDDSSFTSTNISNWNTAYNDKINSASFNTTDGVLTLTQQDGGTVTVDLDGRYLTSETDSQTLSWELGSKNLTISNGNTVTLDGLATEEYVTSQGYITGYTETDTLATVAARGNISNTKLQIRTAGNAAGGNLQLGPYSDGASKWAYITAQHFNSSTEPEGFTLIGGLAQNGQNAVVIGGNIYESNPSTEIQFWTHTADTHSTGGTQIATIKPNGLGIGTTAPDSTLEVNGRVSIRGGNELYFGQSTSAIGSWTTRMYSSGSTHKFNAQEFIFNNEGYGSVEFMKLNASGFSLRGKNTIDSTDSWLRLNQANDYGSGVYTPGLMRADGGFAVVGNVVWHAGNDGAGSGLDADLLDGIQSSRVVYGDNTTATTYIAEASINTALKSGFYTVGSSGLGYIPNATSVNFLIHAAYYGEGNLAGIDLLSNDSTTSNLYFRNATGGGKGPWRTIITNANIGSQSVSYATSAGNADTLDGYHETSFIRLAANSSSPTNGLFAIGSASSRNFIQSHGGQPLDINPLGNAVNVGSTLTVSGAVYATATVVTASEGREVQTYMPSSYTTDDLVAGHEYGWYSDHWRLGMTRTGGAAGGDFVIQWNGARRLSLTNGGGLIVTGNVVASGGNSTNWNTAYGWGNHASAGYFKLDTQDPITIQSETVTFSGNVVIEGTLTESSSIRYKENIQPLEPALAKVEHLKPVTYTKIATQEEEIGLIAEEVAELFPEVVKYNEEGQPDGLNYSRLSVILLKAVQELTERVNKLENK